MRTAYVVARPAGFVLNIKQAEKMGPHPKSWGLYDTCMAGWAEWDKDVALLRAKVAFARGLIRVRIVPESDYRKLMAAWRKQEGK